MGSILRPSSWTPLAGFGTQALGLAARGYRLHGSDLSECSVVRAKREAQKRGIAATFSVADIRGLVPSPARTFDAVLTCDNALPHLLEVEDLRQTCRGIRSCLRPGGLFVASIRDYDAALAQGDAGRLPSGTVPTIIESPAGRRVVTQAWSWRTLEPIYDVHLFILEEHNGTWAVQHHQSTYRAYRRAEISGVLTETGFSKVAWLMPDQTRYYQPLVTART